MKAIELDYGTCVKTPLTFEKAVEAAKAALKNEGFGVLCEIDVQKTLKEKIGLDFQRYLILGACNPHMASRALQLETQLGLLLPCNVVVTEQDGQTLVSAIDAEALLGIVGEASLRPIAADVNARLGRVLAAVQRNA